MERNYFPVGTPSSSSLAPYPSSLQTPAPVPFQLSANADLVSPGFTLSRREFGADPLSGDTSGGVGSTYYPSYTTGETDASGPQHFPPDAYTLPILGIEPTQYVSLLPPRDASSGCCSRANAPASLFLLLFTLLTTSEVVLRKAVTHHFYPRNILAVNVAVVFASFVAFSAITLAVHGKASPAAVASTGIGAAPGTVTVASGSTGGSPHVTDAPVTPPRRRAGTGTPAQRSCCLPRALVRVHAHAPLRLWPWFALIGALDACVLSSSLFASRTVPLALLGVYAQAVVPVSVLVAACRGGARFARAHYAACALLVAAVLWALSFTAATDGGSGSDGDGDGRPDGRGAGAAWAAVLLLTALPMSLGAVLRERLLLHPDPRWRAEEHTLNWGVTLSQFVATLAAAPVMLAMQGLPCGIGDVFISIAEAFGGGTGGSSGVQAVAVVSLCSHCLVVVGINFAVTLMVQRGHAAVLFFAAAASLLLCAGIGSFSLPDEALGTLTLWWQWVAVAAALTGVSLFRAFKDAGAVNAGGGAGRINDEEFLTGAQQRGMYDEALLQAIAAHQQQDYYKMPTPGYDMYCYPSA